MEIDKTFYCPTCKKERTFAFIAPVNDKSDVSFFCFHCFDSFEKKRIVVRGSKVVVKRKYTVRGAVPEGE